ncbi:peptidylprolyl isomerase fpr3 [Gnomoniopsis smithogilvyi]|uniref:FK506-binding protein n=1 Tax=Gnomoniopsis smithogilvyi TaxID=1191159 RepID=A0A9W9D047_9PEZI|nr:peptidylprolyl isomerase fpr3 [Gnomoniopsis smithogilvyi]
MPYQPIALYGLEVPPGDFLVPITQASRVTIRLTMAAIDPTEEVEEEDGQPPRRPRSTLKLIKQNYDDQEDDEDDSDDEYLRDLLMNGDDEDDSEDGDDDEVNGGPSDPSRSKKALKAARLQELLDATKDEDDSDEEMADAEPKKKNGAKALANGKGKGKGKAAASKEEDEEEDEESESDDEEDNLEGLNLQHYTICTLDTEAHYQQPIDLTVGEGEKAFFVNTGTHTVYVTGNYVIDEANASESDEDSDDDDEYDLPPGMEDLIGDESEDDELDNIDGAGRVEEMDTDEEDVPQLVPAKKGNNKRPATDEAEGLDELIAKDEPKLSKKQAKKLKTNEGKAVAAEKDTPKSEKKLGDKSKKPAIRTEKGVQIDDRKVGTGRTAKPGDKVGMRYIGKLENGKVFDSNKKGPPFSFKLGKGEVIEGWDIGVKGMAIGGERRLTIPPSKAYGSKSMGGIPGNSTLIFDIKLLEIK